MPCRARFRGMNLALLHQYQIRYMVTKESGASGGFSEKISAAKKAGVSVFVIENPEAENGEQKENLEEILQEIERLTGKHIRRKQMQVSLVGIGMGNTKLITEEAAERIKGADLLFGAKRLLDAVPAQWNVAAERLPYYLAKDILPCLDDAGEKKWESHFPCSHFIFRRYRILQRCRKNGAGIAGQGEHGGVRLSWDFLGFLSGCAQW